MSELPNFVPGTGNPYPKLIVIGEAPGEDEDEQREPFVGRTGKLVKQMLSLAGMDPNEVYYTNVEKYRPPDNKLKRMVEYGKRPFEDVDLLWKEMDNLKDTACAALVLGGHSLAALTGKQGKNNGISVWRGSIMDNLRYTDNEIKVIPSYHPAFILRQGDEGSTPIDSSAIAYVQLDFIRAVQQSRFRGFKLPSPNLEICKSDKQLRRFFKQYHVRGRGDRVSIDIESTKGACIPTCIGFAFNKDHGLSVPLLAVGDVGISINELAKIWKTIAEFFDDESLRIIGQNFKFDYKKLYNTCRIKLPRKVWFDVGMCAHILYPEFPKGLDFLTSVWTEHPFYKHELKFFDPSIDSFDDILYYNAKDVVVPFEIHEKMLEELKERNLHDFFFNEIMPLEWVYREIDEEGIGFDKNLQITLRNSYRERRDKLRQELYLRIGHKINFQSWQQVKKLLENELKLPKRKDTREDTIVQLLANHCQDNAEKAFILNGIIDDRKLDRTVTSLSAATDYDGKMRTIYNPNATGTGRTGCNILGPPDRPTNVGYQGQNQTKHGEIGPEIRRCYIPKTKGKVIGQADSSQGEARIVAHLARDTYHLDLLANKQDFYKIIATWFFGGEVDDVTKDKRFIGKTAKLMLNYNAKKRRLSFEVNTNARKFGILNSDTGLPINVSERECQSWINIFLANSPNLPDIYWREVIEAYNRDNKTLTAASGRTRKFFGFYDPNLYYAYIPQASLSDNTKFAIRRIKERRPQTQIWLELHDAINWECWPEEFTEIAELVREEMEAPIRLDRCSLPRDPFVIPCDIEWGPNYGDLVKWDGKDLHKDAA